MENVIEIRNHQVYSRFVDTLFKQGYDISILTRRGNAPPGPTGWRSGCVSTTPKSTTRWQAGLT